MSHYEEKYRATTIGIDVNKAKRNPWKWATFILAMVLLALTGYEAHRYYRLHNQVSRSRIIKDANPKAHQNVIIQTPKQEVVIPSPAIVKPSAN